jgi:hypothetical protein
MILGISMQKVREERIINEEIRKRFFNIPLLTDYAKIRTLKYISKTMGGKDEAALQKQCITAYCHSPNCMGGQQPHKDLFMGWIQSSIPTTGRDVPLKTWAKHAQDKEERELLVQ